MPFLGMGAADHPGSPWSYNGRYRLKPGLAACRDGMYVDVDGAAYPLAWSFEEMAQSIDRPVAKFYLGLDDHDRVIFATGHIDINADFRDPGD